MNEALIFVHVLLKFLLNEIEAIHRNHLWSNGYARSRVLLNVVEAE